MHFGNIKVCRGTIISIVGGGVLGALSGGLVSYFLTKKILDENKHECVCESVNIDDVYNEIFDDGFVKLEDGITYDEVNPLKKSDDLKNEIFQKIYNREASLYNSSIDDEDEEDEEDEENEDSKEEIQNIFDSIDLDEVDAMEKAESVGGKPYVISYEDFFETCKDFTKTTIGWYPKERILADENNEQIPEDEWSDWVGDEGLNSFGLGPSYDGDVVFIRNPYTHHDYEVIRFEHERYSEEDTAGTMNE